jgi:GNAT superfamily N-acetyltransferase
VSVVVRLAVAGDAAEIAAMADELRLHQKDPVGNLTPEVLRRDAFGAKPQIRVLIATLDGVPAGYALSHDSYDPAYAARGVYLADLYVRPRGRRRGIGRALAAAVAADARSRGRSFVWWASQRWNAEAHAFYTAIGALTDPINAHAVVFGAFELLADRHGGAL